MSTALASLRQQTNKYILNHDIMNCTAEGVTGNHLYSGRALAISEPWDIVQIHPDLKPLYHDICSHYARVGLQHSLDVIWNLEQRHLGAHIGYQPSVFYYGENESKYWGDDAWRRIVAVINSKNNFMRLATWLGMEIPYTRCFDSVREITSQHIEDVVYPSYLKAAVSVAGVGIYRCRDQGELEQALTRFSDNTPVQIQEEIDSNIFLNLQYKVVGNQAVRLAASEQILTGFAHQGNRVPACHEPWHVVDDMAAWLVKNGMKGVFAFDVAVVETSHGQHFPAIECNPRFNGATYPTLIAQKLNIPEWCAINFNTRWHNLANFEIEDLEYDSHTGTGIVIVNWGTVLTGKVSILIAGPSSYRNEISKELERRLG